MKSIDHFLLTACLILLFSCKSQTNIKDELKDSTAITKSVTDNLPFPEKFLGTWISHSKRRFQIVEIKDSLNATVYLFDHWHPIYDTIKKERIAYFKSEGRIEIWEKSWISIQTTKYRRDYEMRDDTLFEVDKMGWIDTLMRVYSDSTIER